MPKISNELAKKNAYEAYYYFPRKKAYFMFDRTADEKFYQMKMHIQIVVSAITRHKLTYL